jgi:putative ABC transport system permease protein
VTFLLENLRLGFRNLQLHALRSLLTAMGIIFGVAAVIIMVAIGQGAKQQAREQMNRLGATNLLVRSVMPPASNDANSQRQRMVTFGITDADFARLEMLNGVEQIVPLRDVAQKVIRGDTRADARAIATTPELFDVIGLRPARGNVLNEVLYRNAEPVCVLGARAADQLFPNSDPVGETIQVGSSGNALILEVVGVLLPTGLRGGSESTGIIQRDIDQDVYFPLSLANHHYGEILFEERPGAVEIKKVALTEIWIQTDRIENVESLAGRASNVLGLPDREDVQVKAPLDILREAERLGAIFNFIMVGIASFSLVVGGIGIMNIMLATVTERTKEIGIRRALGAKRKHITLQFLIETTTISLAGGMLGVSIGFVVATTLPDVVEWFNGQQYPTNVTGASVIASFAVSGLIGIGFGLYPAVKAAKMNPIDALRHE